MAIDRAVKRCNPCLLLVGMIFALFVLLAFCTREASAWVGVTPPVPSSIEQYYQVCLGEGVHCEYHFISASTLAPTDTPDDGSCPVSITISVKRPNIPDDEYINLLVSGWPPGETKWFPRGRYDFVGVTCDKNRTGTILRVIEYMV